MKKVFISQPMKDKTDIEIKNERNKIIKYLNEKFGEIEILDSFFEGCPHDAKPLWFLGKSLQVLSNADIVVFAKGWDKYRGCRIEHTCAKEYGIEIVEIQNDESGYVGNNYDKIYGSCIDKK